MCWASPVFHSLTNFHKRFDSFFSSPPYLTPPSFFLPFTRLSTSSEGLLLPSSSFSPRPPPYGLVGYSTSKFNSKTGFFLPIALLSSVIIRGIWGTFACSHTHLHTSFSLGDECSFSSLWFGKGNFEQLMQLAPLYVYCICCSITLMWYQSQVLFLFILRKHNAKAILHLGWKNMHFQWTCNSL